VKRERDVLTKQRTVRRLVVPVVLGVTVLGAAAAAVSATAGCGDDAPVHDASVDAAPDTPIV
jgi:hypothetical protein